MLENVTHIHTCVYMYICVCVRVCVCVAQRADSGARKKDVS